MSSYYEDRIIRACDASKRLELYDINPVSGYVALSKISFVYNFYNIRTTQEVLFFGKDDIPVETDKCLVDYRKKKDKLIKDIGVALVESLATTNEAVKLYDSITDDEWKKIESKDYIKYVYKVKHFDTTKYNSDMGEKINKYSLMLI